MLCYRGVGRASCAAPWHHPGVAAYLCRLFFVPQALGLLPLLCSGSDPAPLARPLPVPRGRADCFLQNRWDVEPGEDFSTDFIVIAGMCHHSGVGRTPWAQICYNQSPFTSAAQVELSTAGHRAPSIASTGKALLHVKPCSNRAHHAANSQNPLHTQPVGHTQILSLQCSFYSQPDLSAVKRLSTSRALFFCAHYKPATAGAKTVKSCYSQESCTAPLIKASTVKS